MALPTLPAAGADWSAWGAGVHNALGSTTTLAGAGIDPTGTADSTTAVKALLAAAPAGALIVVPAGAIIRCTDTLTVSAAGAMLTGRGELRFTAGIEQKAAIRVTGQGATVRDVRITNPNALRSQTGERNIGIEIAAHDVTVIGCLIDTFQNGVIVDADGEWENTAIVGNRIKDITGAGDGASNSTSTFGEDRGDGIVGWGAHIAIVGNVINCKVGSDARIGIHVEGLPVFEAVTNIGHPDALATITGNVIYGQFRRGITSEDVSNAVITGNTVADSTWWAIALAGSSVVGCVVSGNTILWTRTATDNQGAAWGPTRAPICIRGGTKNARVGGNVVRVLGVADAGLLSIGDGTSAPINCTFADNSIVTEGSGVLAIGVLTSGPATSLRVTGNTIIGFNSIGCYINVDGAQVIDNHFDGVAATAGGSGIRREGASTLPTVVSGNVVRNVETGINWVNVAYARVNDNTVDTATTGLELFGSSNCLAVGNLFKSVTNHLSNTGGAGNVVANNN